MTIIERALKKHRPTAEAAALAVSKRPRLQPSVIDPEVRLPRTPAVLDTKVCRDRRVLLATESDDDKAYGAAYRMLRTRLLQRARIGNWSTIAVTSAGPNDGKTLTIINLALSLAREKTREIVLLDMDMRNPSVCRVLGIRPPRQLHEHLEHGSDFQGLFSSVGSDNLLVAGNVTPSEHASELLLSPKFDDLIEAIKRGTVDPIILLDLPPVLVTDDALVVAPKIDAILVVAAESVTDRTEFSQALNILSEFPLAGVVLNRAAETLPDYNYAYEGELSSEAGNK